MRGTPKQCTNHNKKDPFLRPELAHPPINTAPSNHKLLSHTSASKNTGKVIAPKPTEAQSRANLEHQIPAIGLSIGIWPVSFQKQKLPDVTLMLNDDTVYKVPQTIATGSFIHSMLKMAKMPRGQQVVDLGQLDFLVTAVCCRFY